jgi:ppGpp synthetase/RelA/SpoT-type nucleotidyltranferase
MGLSKSALSRRFNQEEKRFERAEKELMRVLQETVEDLGSSYKLRPVPLIHGRRKDFESFYKKAQELEAEGRVTDTASCFVEIHDIARGRIICQTLQDCERAKRLLEDNKDLFVDGVLTIEVHEPSETGYRAIHMDVEVTAQVDGGEVSTPCEIQIVTALQFAWGLYTHADFYKGALVSPVVADLMRELSELLHVADKVADRLIAEVEAAQGPQPPGRAGRISSRKPTPSRRVTGKDTRPIGGETTQRRSARAGGQQGDHEGADRRLTTPAAGNAA